MKFNTPCVQPGTAGSTNSHSTYRKAFVGFALLVLVGTLAAPAMAQFNEGFESGIPTGWTVSAPTGLAGAANATSGITPTQGSYYGWISTGCMPHSQGGITPGTDCPTVAATAASYGSLYQGLGTNGLPVEQGLGLPTTETTLTSPSFVVSTTSPNISFDVNFITTDGTYNFADFAVAQLIPLSSDSGPIPLFVANTTCDQCAAVPPVGLAPGGGTMTVGGNSLTAVYFSGATATFGSITYGNVPKFNTDGCPSGCPGGPSAWIHVTYNAPAGTYQLQFLVSHVGDTNYPSALAIDNVQIQTTQTIEPGPITPNTVTTATFSNTQGQENIHSLKLPSAVTYQNGVANPQLLSTNVIVSNNGGIQQYTFMTPFATGTLLEEVTDDQLAGGTGFGSLIADKCYQGGNDPSTATFAGCPVSTPPNPISPSPADLINLTELFDVQGTLPDIPAGTTIAMIHHPGQNYGPNTPLTDPNTGAQIPLPPTGDWVPVPSGANSNPVCNNVQWDPTNEKTNDCTVEDILLYDPAIKAQGLSVSWGVFGDQLSGSSGTKKRGVIGLMNNVPIPTTQLSVNGMALNSPGVQDGHGTYWFNSQSLNLDFLVNPAGVTAGTGNTNGWYAAPVLGLAYVFWNNNTTPEPLLPDPPNCSPNQAQTSTCALKGGTPGMFTGGVAAPDEWVDTIASASFSEGVVNTLAWTGKDTVTGERNVQLLHSGPCPNPNGIPGPINPPCYSTSLFYELIGKDTTAPTINITVPANNAPYTINQQVASNFVCNDPLPGSGVATCLGNGNLPSGNNIDTTSCLGKTFTVNATDNALPPNKSSLTVNYNVACQFIGFTSPIANPPAINVVKAGRAIPVGWQVLNANGIGITGLQLGAQNGGVAGGTVVLTSTNSNICAHDTIDNTVVVDASGNSGLQDLGGGNYQFNWKTTGIPSGACQQLSVNPGDGTSHIVYFQFK